MSSTEKLEQFKLVYDYVKFHMGLYIGVPPVLAILAESLDINTSPWYQAGLSITIAIYAFSGAHAGLFMGRTVNAQWTPDYVGLLEKNAYSAQRRFIHHTLFWIGLAFGLGGLGGAFVFG